MTRRRSACPFRAKKSSPIEEDVHPIPAAGWRNARYLSCVLAPVALRPRLSTSVRYSFVRRAFPQIAFDIFIQISSFILKHYSSKGLFLQRPLHRKLRDCDYNLSFRRLKITRSPGADLGGLFSFHDYSRARRLYAVILPQPQPLPDGTPPQGDRHGRRRT